MAVSFELLDINLEFSHCKKTVQPFLVGRGERLCRDDGWIDHSWEDYAAVSERGFYHLR